MSNKETVDKVSKLEKENLGLQEILFMILHHTGEQRINIDAAKHAVSHRGDRVIYLDLDEANGEWVLGVK